MGIFLEYQFRDRFRDFLEIACGSGRDSVYLAKKGKNVWSVDYEEKLIEKIQTIFRDIPNIHFQVENAFNLSFKSNTFDLSFHNGFYILYPEDEKIYQLLREQVRVTRNYVVFAVHNRLNNRLFRHFKTLSKKEKLYDVRFFSPKELLDIISKCGIKYKEIKVRKFGGIVDVFYKKQVKILPNPLYKFRQKIVPALYRYIPWINTERILIILKLDK